jgi:hypothetical protein
MGVTADLPDLNLWLALACPSIRTEGGQSAGVTVLLATNVLLAVVAPDFPLASAAG